MFNLLWPKRSVADCDRRNRMPRGIRGSPGTGRSRPSDGGGRVQPDQPLGAPAFGRRTNRGGCRSTGPAKARADAGTARANHRRSSARIHVPPGIHSKKRIASATWDHRLIVLQRHQRRRRECHLVDLSGGQIQSVPVNRRPQTRGERDLAMPSKLAPDLSVAHGVAPVVSWLIGDALQQRLLATQNCQQCPRYVDVRLLAPPAPALLFSAT